MKTQHTRAEYTLSKQEVQNIINTSEEFRDRVILKCLYYGGMRVIEVCSLKINHIDFNRKVINIIESKGGKTRTIPFIDANYMTDLRHWIGKKDEGYVFHSRQGNKETITDRNIRFMSQKVGEKSKIKNPNPLMKHINPHLFRHSIARHLKDDGYKMEFVQKFLGHSSMKTTADMYGTLSLENMQQIVARKTGDHNLLANLRVDIPEVEYRRE